MDVIKVIFGILFVLGLVIAVVTRIDNMTTGMGILK